MYWRLSAAVTACVAADRILFLDVAKDRYFALPPSLSESFLTWLEAPQTELPESCAAALAGFGTAGLRPSRCTVPSPLPLDSKALARHSVSARDLVSVGRCVVSAYREVRSQPLAAVLARRFPASRPKGAPVGDLEARLATFRSARPWIPVPRVCLHDALALMDWLGASAGGVTLVFGVSTYPFAAHSWVQTDRMVLDDHPESPSRFQPILHLP